MTRLLAVAAACALATAPDALATPGVPAAPTPLFAEDFENVSPSQTPLLVGLYLGSAPLHVGYTGDPAWIDGRICDGVITSADSADYDGCSARDNVSIRALAAHLGAFNGTVPATSNHAVTAYTSADPGAGKVQLATAMAIPLATAGRFVRFSMDVSAVNCAAGRPSLMPYLLDGATRLQTFSAAIDPCPGVDSATTTFAAARAVLVSGAATGIEISNATGSGIGNDLAIDDLSLVDVTPQLDESFSSPVARVAASRITLTITNTSDLLSKARWYFTETLPSGLRLAATPNAATTCANTTLTAAPSSSAIGATGDLETGSTSCTVQADVVADAPGTYVVHPASVAPHVGLNAPAAPASVTFQAPTPPPPPPPPGPPPPGPRPTPELGKSVVVAAVSGTVRVKTPGSAQFVDLGQLSEVPLGSRIDTRKGKVLITAEVDARTHRTQSSRFFQGVFDVRQTKGARPILAAQLAGGDFSGCATLSAPIPAFGFAAKAMAAKGKRSKRRVRRLWGHGKGSFETDGRRSTAVVRGTWWFVEDRCDGTFTYVRRGYVDVHDVRLKKTVRVVAGRAYLARAP